MFKATGINADNIDEMSDKLEELANQSGFTADPTEFLKSLAAGDDFGGSFEDDDDYEFDEDSTPVGIADPEDAKDGENKDKEEGKKPSIFDSIFGMGKDKPDEEPDGKNTKDSSKCKS
jgi:ATP-dependent Clp protease ATP-binding subunit ClpE